MSIRIYFTRAEVGALHRLLRSIWNGGADGKSLTCESRFKEFAGIEMAADLKDKFEAALEKDRAAACERLGRSGT